MAEIICIAGHQCGCGKTTTAVNLALAASWAGNRTLLVDGDPKGDTTTYFRGAHGFKEGLIHVTAYEGLDVCPWPNGTSPRGGGSLVVSPDVGGDASNRGLPHAFNGYDLVLVDCPHSAGEITERAFAWAEEVLLVVSGEPFFMEYLPPLIQLVRKRIAAGGSLDFRGVLVSERMEDGPAKEIEDQIREFFGEIVFDTVIPWDAGIRDAGIARQPLWAHAHRSRGARAYLELCQEVLES